MCDAVDVVDMREFDGYEVIKMTMRDKGAS